MNGWTDAQMDERTERRTDGWTDGRTDGQTDGRPNGGTNISRFKTPKVHHNQEEQKICLEYWNSDYQFSYRMKN